MWPFTPTQIHCQCECECPLPSFPSLPSPPSPSPPSSISLPSNYHQLSFPSSSLPSFPTHATWPDVVLIFFFTVAPVWTFWRMIRFLTGSFSPSISSSATADAGVVDPREKTKEDSLVTKELLEIIEGAEDRELRVLVGVVEMSLRMRRGVREREREGVGVGVVAKEQREGHGDGNGNLSASANRSGSVYDTGTGTGTDLDLDLTKSDEGEEEPNGIVVSQI